MEALRQVEDWPAENAGVAVVRADGAGSPSRTSVNRFGDVAVANRLGGVAKIVSSESRCVERNGIPGIQTSHGAKDVLSWGQDECVTWFAEIPHGDNRPVAWTHGQFNPLTCEWEDVDVWTAWSDGAPGTAVVALLDKRLDGFGELFRMLSYQEIGAAAMLSRATAGVRNGTLVFALPGSPAGVRLALDKLILPELGHLLFEVRR